MTRIPQTLLQRLTKVVSLYQLDLEVLINDLISEISLPTTILAMVITVSLVAVLIMIGIGTWCFIQR